MPFNFLFFSVSSVVPPFLSFPFLSFPFLSFPFLSFPFLSVNSVSSVVLPSPLFVNSVYSVGNCPSRWEIALFAYSVVW
ncbi:MAG: hypothetical protein D6679_01660 [Candidatus Hydrogenedentota bacterium]|nr:MAG: hypothetical protein D6679_01660 [Candidatus Hydrogenedentota bacterium]